MQRARDARRRSRPTRTTPRSTPSRARSSTSCAPEGRREVVRALLRDGRRDAAVPRPALGGLALDGRRELVARLREPALRGARLDRRLRRPRRRRLRRVPAAHPTRPREPVVEGLGRLAALPRRPIRRASDRAGRGAGLRLRREAAAGRARPRGRGATATLADAARARRPTSCARASTRRSGSTSAAATTRSRSTATSGRSTRSARTSATCSGAASSRDARVEAIVDALMRRRALVGLGGAHDVHRRTRRYNPLCYHNGTVWPHDNLSDRRGASRGTGAGPSAQRISRRCSRPPATSTTRSRRSSPASPRRRRRSRSRTRRPRGRRPGRPARRCSCCSSCSASSPTGARRPLGTLAAAELPSWAGALVPRRRPRVRPAVGRRRRGAGASSESSWRHERSQSSAPSGSPSRRPATAGSSGSSALLADGLVDAGHDVTLFASGRLAHEGASSSSVFEEAPSERIGHTLPGAAARPRLLRARATSST